MSNNDTKLDPIEETIKDYGLELPKNGKEDKKGYLDLFLGKFTSRKLLVFGISTWLLFSKVLTPEHWVWIALIYIGSQGAVDIVATIKKAK